MIYNTLNTSIMFCEPKLEFKSKDVSAHSLRSAGAMALLCDVIYSYIINLIGR